MHLWLELFGLFFDFTVPAALSARYLGGCHGQRWL